MLASPAHLYMPHLFSLHPLVAHHHLCYVDVYCGFFKFLIYATFLYDSILDCLCTYFRLIVFLYHFILAVCLICVFLVY